MTRTTCTGRQQHKTALVAIIAVISSVVSSTTAALQVCSPPRHLLHRQPSSVTIHRRQPLPSSQIHRQLVSSSVLLASAKDDDAKLPRALGTLQAPTIVGSVTAVVIIARVLTTTSTTSSRLFQQHVVGAVMGSLVFLPAAIRSVQTRVDAVQAMKNRNEESPATRREALLSHIQAHLYLTYAAALCAIVSLSSIFYNKRLLGKPHFTSLHSRLGLLAVALWTGAYIVAQTKVWTPMIKKMQKTNILAFQPRLLWASKWHRTLGKVASVMTLLTAASGVGLSAWGRTAFGSSSAGTVLVVAAILSVPITLIWPRK